MSTYDVIKKALDQGYEPAHTYMSHVFGAPGSIDMNERELYGVFLDPSFWQSLGKALGWLASHFDAQDGVNGANCWECEWHRFIDYLAKGQNAEEFFATLK